MIDKTKYLDIVDMLKSGMKEVTIAKIKGVSRQRINKIKKFFPNIKFPEKRGGRGIKKNRLGFFNLICKNCGKVSILSKNKINLKKVFCDQECFRNYNGWIKYPKFTNKKEKNRIRCLLYYNRHKDDTHFRNKKRLYNRTQSIRLRKLKKL